VGPKCAGPEDGLVSLLVIVHCQFYYRLNFNLYIARGVVYEDGRMGGYRQSRCRAA